MSAIYRTSDGWRGTSGRWADRDPWGREKYWRLGWEDRVHGETTSEDEAMRYCLEELDWCECCESLQPNFDCGAGCADCELANRKTDPCPSPDQWETWPAPAGAAE